VWCGGVQAEAQGPGLVGPVPARGQLPRAAAARRRLPAVRRPASLQRGPHSRRRGKRHGRSTARAQHAVQKIVTFDLVLFSSVFADISALLLNRNEKG
jgi:hypothetical protein